MMKSLKITLLSLAAGTYKYLQDTGAFDPSGKELLEDGSVTALGAIGKSTVDTLNSMCTKDGSSNFIPLAALGTAIGMWFFFDSIIDYDENGGVEFRIPVLTDRYTDA